MAAMQPKAWQQQIYMMIRAGNKFQNLLESHLRLKLLAPGCNLLCHLTVGMLGRVTGSPDPELSATDCAWLRLAWMVELNEDMAWEGSMADTAVGRVSQTCRDRQGAEVFTFLPEERCLKHQAVSSKLYCKSAMRLNGCHCSWHDDPHLQIQNCT